MRMKKKLFLVTRNSVFLNHDDFESKLLIKHSKIIQLQDTYNIDIELILELLQDFLKTVLKRIHCLQKTSF